MPEFSRQSAYIQKIQTNICLNLSFYKCFGLGTFKSSLFSKVVSDVSTVNSLWDLKLHNLTLEQNCWSPLAQSTKPLGSVWSNSGFTHFPLFGALVLEGNTQEAFLFVIDKWFKDFWTKSTLWGKICFLTCQLCDRFHSVPMGDKMMDDVEIWWDGEKCAKYYHFFDCTWHFTNHRANIYMSEFGGWSCSDSCSERSCNFTHNWMKVITFFVIISAERCPYEWLSGTLFPLAHISEKLTLTTENIICAYTLLKGAHTY